MAKFDLLSRRATVKGIGAAALASCGIAPAARAQFYKPQEQMKLTQKAAHYQDGPMKDESCASCPYFIQPNACVTVDGPVSVNGWCPMYTQFSPFDRGAHCAGAKSC